MSVEFAPEAVIERFSELLAQGDLDAMVELYEPDATFAPQPGAQVTGRAAIRDALAAFLAVQPRMTGHIQKVLCAGGTASRMAARPVTCAPGWGAKVASGS